MFYRLAHWFWRRGWLLLGRLLSNAGRFFTGIDIHPGAVIGRRLFIDHGMALVIGETAEIGNDVTLYQGVTLGGVAPSVNSAAQVHRKRHPTLRNGAIVGPRAHALAPRCSDPSRSARGRGWAPTPWWWRMYRPA